MTTRPELIAPAGNMDCVRAAVANGADAVYFGLQQFNARMRADNFTVEQLPKLVGFLHDRRVKAYGTLNTLVFTDELPAAEAELLQLNEAGVDAVLVQDLGVAALARELGLRLEVHASTQMTITSPEGVKFAERLGVKRVVIARETSLREMARFQGIGVHPDATSGDVAYSGAIVGRVPPRGEGSRIALEVFVHGALCIAYSGQCLTSEALGQRSANRGECAQACRLPYQLIVDGVLCDLGDRRYLLSPQDLAAVEQIPELIRLGVTGFKIEGRLKTPEYVAATCQVYRKAIDAVINHEPSTIAEADHYKLEMTFSRGFHTGWLHGVNHQALVHARFGKKRGPFLGRIKSVGTDHVEIDFAFVGAPFQVRPDPSRADVSAVAASLDKPAQAEAPGSAKAEARPAVAPYQGLQAGDGVVFDTGGDTDREQGGRVWEVRENRLYFERNHIDFTKLKPGDRVWKTSDPKLERVLRQTFKGEIPKPKTILDITVSGAVGQSLVLEGVVAGAAAPVTNREDDNRGGREPRWATPLTGDAAPTASATAYSKMPLQTAYRRPLTKKILRDQLGRMGETDFVLGELHNQLVGQVILPVSELNRLRRELVEQIVSSRRSDIPVATGPKVESRQECRSYKELLPHRDGEPDAQRPQLVALCRTTEQIHAALDVGCDSIYLDFEDLRRYADAVALIRSHASLSDAPPLRRSTVFLATPRIQKAGEQGFFKIIEQAAPDGVLIRNLGALDYFRSKGARPAVAPYRLIGDFSLNVANPLTADLLMREGLERLTVSYDCNAQQVIDLLRAAPPHWFELTIHQHMPMFHMEHCVFAAFMTNGTDATNCGRPCDVHNLKVRDRVGMDHPVKADVGCRNTVYHGRAQSGAEFLRSFMEAGARAFRVELLEENAEQARQILQSYRDLLTGTTDDPRELMRRLNVVRQLGVTSGTLTVLG